MTRAAPGHLTDALVALDFDGTLAPIVTNPAESRPVDGAVDLLRELAHGGAQVAIITGRDVQTVLGLGGFTDIQGLIVAGLYGAEWWQGGELTTLPTPPAIERLRTELPTVLAANGADPATWIEDKRLSLVVHMRTTADPATELAKLRQPVSDVAAAAGLEVHRGRSVIELRLPDFDKGSALRELIRRTGRQRIFFAGDDVGDLPAFDLLIQLRAEGSDATAVVVASAEVTDNTQRAMHVVDGPAALIDFLRQWAAARD